MLGFTGTLGVVAHLTFSPDAKRLAAGGESGGLEMWDVPARRKWGRYTGHISFYPAPIAFHPTEPQCFACANSALAVIDTNAETVRLLQLSSGTEWLVQPAVTPDGGSVVARVHGYSGGDVRCFRILRDAKKPLKQVWAAPFEQLTGRHPRALDLGLMRIAPDGQTFAALWGELDRRTWTVKLVRVSLRSMAKGAVLWSAKLPAGTTHALAFAPDSETFVTCRTHIMSVWQTNDPEAKPREVRSDSRQHLTAVAFHPGGRYLAATSNDTTVKLYDTTTWEVTRSFTWDIGRLRSVAFSPDGMLAAVGSDSGQIVVWDLEP